MNKYLLMGVSFAVGAGIGFYVAKRKYDAQLADEIASIKKAYKNASVDDSSTKENEIPDQEELPFTDAYVALAKVYSPSPEPRESVKVLTPERVADMLGEPELEVEEYVYYIVDRVLLDDSEEIVESDHPILHVNFDNETAPTVSPLYIYSETRNLIYEVHLRMDSYSETVGFEDGPEI